MNSNCKYVFRRRPGASGLWACLLAVIGAAGLAASAHAQAFTKVSRTLIAAEESCPNNAIDPGETNTVTFVIKNNSGADRANVKARLLNSGNVAFSTSGQITIGNMAKDATASVNIRFRAGGSCGGSLTPTVLVTADGVGDTQVAFDSFQLGETITQNYEFSNTGAITINDFATADNLRGRASPYPSSINVSGVPNQNGVTGDRVSKITATLRGISHSFSRDINVLLVSPNGHKILLLREVGGTGAFAPVNNATLTFSAGANQIPLNSQIPGGASTVAPTTHAGTGNALPSDALADPYSTDLNSLVTGRSATDGQVTGTNPNGAWKLYVQDDQTGDIGSISGGWTLTLTTSRISCCGAGEAFPYITKDGAPAIPQVEVNEDTENTVVGFTVGDVESGNLTVTASSSDESLVKSSEIAVEGAVGSENRSIKIKKIEPNRFGTTVITITVTDTTGRSSSISFNFKVNSVNDAPTFPNFIRNQQFVRGSTTPNLPFTVADVETPAGDLIVTGVSSDDDVVRDNDIVFGGSGANRTVQLIPVGNGNTTISLTVRDSNGAETTRTFTVNFNADPGDPTISPIDNTSTNEDTAKDIGFTIRTGSTTSVDNLQLTAATGNPAILPLSGIQFSGTGTERNVRLTPALNQSGAVTVTITVTDPLDPVNRVQATAFTLTVNSVNDNPSIESQPDRTINEDTNTGDIAIRVNDQETPGANLTLTGTSSNQGVVPDANITFGGGGVNRTYRVTPLPHAFGKATITLTVTDGDGGSTSTQFVLTVNGVNDDPTITQVRAPGDVTTGLGPDISPTVVTIPEDIAVETVDGVSRVVEQTLQLEGITAGAGDETEQTVSLTATLANNNVIDSIRISNPSNGQVKSPTIQATLAYRPKRNAFGTTEVTLTLTDNAADGIRTITRKFKIAVTPVNDVPTISDIPNQSPRSNQQGIQVPFSVSDVETPAGQMNVVATSDNQAIVRNEKITINAARTIIGIVPEAGAIGTATITVVVTDRGALNDGNGTATDDDTFTVEFDATAINNPPTITLDRNSIAIDEEGFADANVTIADDEGVGNVTLSGSSSDTSIVSNILFSEIFDGNKRNVAIIPNPNANGNVTITIVGTDSKGLSSLPQTINLTIRPVEDNPVLTLRGAISDRAHTALEDANPVKDGNNNIEVGISDAETSADNLQVTATSNNQDLVPNGNIEVTSTGSVRVLNIRPAANRSGDARITVTLRDGAGRTATDFFDLTITAVNDAPTLAALNNLTIDEDAGQQTISLSGITAGGGENQTLTVTASSDNAGLIPAPTVSYTSPNESGSITFQPVANESGSAKIRVTVTDTGGTANGGVNTSFREFTVTVRSINDNPQIINNLVDVTGTINEVKGPISITIQDQETLASQLTLSFNSSNSSLVPNTPENLQPTGSGPNRGLIIRPATNVSGTTDITVTVRDPDGGTASKSFKYTVSAGQNPVISDIPDFILPKNTFSSTMTFTVSDSQTPATGLTVTPSTDNSSVISVGNIQFSGSGATRLFIVRSGNNPGFANITFTVRDGDNNTATETFKVTVQGAAPTISAIADQTVSNGGSTGALPFTVNDVETFPGFLELSATSSNTQLVPLNRISFGGDVTSGNRTVTVNTISGQTGSSDIVITVRDSEGQTATESFRVTVQGQAQNTAPTISALNNITIERNQNSGVINFTVGDTETAAADLVVTSSASNTTLIPAAGGILLGTGSPASNRTLLIVPAQNTSGTSTVTLTVRDAGGLTASRTFTVTVPEAQAPTANNIADFDGDGKTDLLFQTHDGFLAIWTITPGFVRTSAAFLNPNNVGDPRWRAFGSGDFNSDGHADIVFQHDDGTLGVWIMNRLNFVRGELLNPGNSGSWRAVAAIDFNRDNKTDIIFQNTDGMIGVWYMDGLTRTSATAMSPSNAGNPQWKVVGAGRIDGDANIDLFFQHDDGTLAAWLMNGSNLVAPALLNPSTSGGNFRVASTFNLDGQGTTDILFHDNAGTLAVWLMSGFDMIQPIFSTPSNTDATWRVVAP